MARLLLSAAVAFLAAYAWHMHVFGEVEVRKREVGEGAIVCQRHVGPYSNLSQAFPASQAALESRERAPRRPERAIHAC